jgi:nucleosome binding factor SPN SPT16 subunit
LKITNNKSGDLILIDAGAEYANYSSDMTRTIPVSGKTLTKKPFTMPFYALRMKLLKCLSQEHFGNSTISK